MDIKQLFLPGACFFCLTKTRGAWCDECERDFILDLARCPVCAQITVNNNVCGACLKRRPYFTNTEVLYNYQYPANYLIKAFKYNNRPELAISFADIMAKQLSDKPILPELLLPVPLHKTRQRERGYNQSLVFANQIAKRMGLKVNSSICSRIKNTEPQSRLPMNTRRRNIKGAFYLKGVRLPEHIAIVDDVITTGSTVNELAALLRKAGCQHIEVWAIARA
ncbi:MAG: ComF family protein [Proteobacteria bacterium]|nr:ComF family protein [Pseudomonadota bacterium]